MNKQNLAIITNEKTYFNNNSYFCDNIDMKSIPEGLDSKYNLQLFVRNSKLERSTHQINLKNIFISQGILSYIFNVLRTNKSHNKYLIISLSPYTFIISIFLMILRKKIFVYLRSDGYEEYKCYSKFFGPLIYHLMFTIVSWRSNLIACRSHILRGKKGKIVYPSQLNQKWFLNRKSPNLNSIKLLYVGRIKIEKGVFSLLKILKEIKLDYKITIINSEKFYDKKLENENINIINFKNKDDSIIKIYDDHNIFVLPSYTEGHPQVLDESLSRMRPVIIFPEISHVIRKREGIIISERNANSLKDKIEYVKKEYTFIQKKMINNQLPTKSDFIEDLFKILNQDLK